MAKQLQAILSASLAMSFITAAQADCEAIKTKIESQLQLKGIQSYSIEIVPVAVPATSTTGATEASPKNDLGRVVGSCDHGSKQLIYRRR